MMNNELLHEANEVLGDLKRRHKRMTQQLDKLKRFEGWVLREGSRKGNGRIYYDAILPGSGKKIYLGGEKHEQVLNILIKGYVHTDYETINSLLPSAYQTNLKEPGIPGSNMPKEAIEWKRQLEAEKAKYPPYKPEELKHPAMDGTMMRSKSEVIIANILIQAGIPFVYEAPIFINGERVLPDFSILSLIDLKTVIIIEHQGIVFLDSYAKKFIRSLRLYLKSDWIPNKTLFFTYDDSRETLDPNQVMSILRKYVCPSL